MLPNSCVIDDFLDREALAALRRHVLAHEASFEASGVRTQGAHGYDTSARQSIRSKQGLEALEPFRRAVEAVTPRLFAALKIPPVRIVDHELEMVAHRHGAFFKPHIDTFTDRNREGETSDRLISVVYYFHAAPKAFDGGELVLHPFGSADEPLAIAPEDNRLVAFPSFAVHEVRPVALADDRFVNARFAINCWLHRARDG